MNDYKISDLTIGHTESFNAVISEDMQEKFLAITGDCSPIHVDEEFAKKNDFKGRVVYGMLTASFYSTLVGVYLPGKNALLNSVDTSFHSYIYIGQEIKIMGEISYINETFNQIEIKAKIISSKDEILSKAKIKVGVRE